MSLKCVPLSSTEHCHWSYLHLHTLAPHNSTVTLPDKAQKQRFTSLSLMEAPAARLSVTRLSFPQCGGTVEKRLCCHFISVPRFLHHFLLNTNTIFQNRSMLWKGADPYNVMETVRRELWGGISVPLEHYAVICNNWSADGTNVISGGSGFVFGAPWLIICSINITIFQLVVNMHAISQPN